MQNLLGGMTRNELFCDFGEILPQFSSVARSGHLRLKHLFPLLKGEVKLWETEAEKWKCKFPSCNLECDQSDCILSGNVAILEYLLLECKWYKIVLGCSTE